MTTNEHEEGGRTPWCSSWSLAFFVDSGSQDPQQVGDAGAGDGGDGVQGDAAGGEARDQIVDEAGRGGIDLVGGDDLRLGGDGGIVERQLAVDDVVVVERVAAAHAAGV